MIDGGGGAGDNTGFDPIRGVVGTVDDADGDSEDSKERSVRSGVEIVDILDDINWPLAFWGRASVS